MVLVDIIIGWYPGCKFIPPLTVSSVGAGAYIPGSIVSQDIAGEMFDSYTEDIKSCAVQMGQQQHHDWHVIKHLLQFSFILCLWSNARIWLSPDMLEAIGAAVS